MNTGVLSREPAKSNEVPGGPINLPLNPITPAYRRGLRAAASKARQAPWENPSSAMRSDGIPSSPCAIRSGHDSQRGREVRFVPFRWFEKAVGVPGIPCSLRSEIVVRRRDLLGKCDDVPQRGAATVNGNEGTCRRLERRSAHEHPLAAAWCAVASGLTMALLQVLVCDTTNCITNA